MPILDLGRFRCKLLGFTLLEIMVVLVIIGISLGLVTPRLMKNNDDILKEESMRLSALMEYAADTAASRGAWLAWSPTTQGYRFLQHDDDKNIWQPINTDDVLRERQLAEGMHLKATLQQQSIATNGLIPFAPSGIHAPFQIELTLGEKKRVIQGDLLGKVNILTSDLSLAQSL